VNGLPKDSAASGAAREQATTSVSRRTMLALAPRRGWLGAAGVSLAVALSGCANQTVQHYAHGKEYFSEKKYGKASPKVVADGQPVPKGGGQYLVGHAYKVAGRTYVPAETTSYTAVGMASWYGAAFHGRRTANGEVYDMGSITAAHPTMPLPSYARVTNLDNGYSVIVRVNDRGPYHGGRVMDVSSRAAHVLGFKGAGTAQIKVEYVGRAPLEGSDDNLLLASLRTDGSPARVDGLAGSTMVAENRPEPGPSVFAALFGPRDAPPLPPRPPLPVAPQPVPPPPPPPESLEVAAAETAPALEPARPTAADATRQPRAVPLPPPRPFDLGEAKSLSGVALTSPAKPSPEAATVLPPRRPELHASTEKALYFAVAASDRVTRLTRSAFERVKPTRRAADDD
jgi:rare lipoprotein A